MPGTGGKPATETVWLFDMDNTLHDCSQGIFNAMHMRMTATIMHLLDVDHATANQLRTRYWRRYGATVIGMERHHRVDPHHFLALSHAFDAHPLIHADSGLPHKFALLEGRKILLTNAPLDYARAVLSHLGILHHFEALWTINHMRLQQRMRPKPSPALMRQVLARLNVPAGQVVLVEDTLKNLKAAKQAGMGTVHVHHAHTPFSAPDRPGPHLTAQPSTNTSAPARRLPALVPSAGTSHQPGVPPSGKASPSAPHNEARANMPRRHRLVRPAYVDVRVNKLGDLLLMRRFNHK